MAGELLVRTLNLDLYENAVATGSITDEMQDALFLDAGHWSLSEFSGPGWVLLDNGDFTDAVPDIIDSTFELQLIAGFRCEEACPTLVTDDVIEIWDKQLLKLLAKADTNPVVLEIAKALMELVELVRRDKKLCLVVQGLL